MGSASFTRLAQLLKFRGFVDVNEVIHKGQKVNMGDYGPAGTMLRHNIMKQWWDLMVHQQSNVFPVESSMIQPLERLRLSNERNTMKWSHEEEDSLLRETLQQDCAAKYLQVLKLTNNRLPFSIASVGPCVSWKNISVDESKEISSFMGHTGRTQMLLQNYIPPSGTNSVFDFWLQLRVSWWKKFSRNPANFTVRSTSNTNNSNKKSNNDENKEAEEKTNGQEQTSMSIMYDFPGWGPMTVEVVRNLGDKYLADLQANSDENFKGKTPGNKSYLPHCIECDTSIEMASAAWLTDSFIERLPLSPVKKEDKAKKTQVLQLHPQIAPYQVAIMVSLLPTLSASSESTSLTEMNHLCNQLEKELRKMGISVINASTHGSTVDAHFKRNDELGIPYTAIVNETTLSEGLVKIRNRDNQIIVDGHITSVADSLCQNLNAQLE